MKWFRPRLPSGIAVGTSQGIFNLSADEFHLLEAIVAGTSTMDEGQRFYQSVTGRGLPFPLEWEAPILRATIAQLPEREDLRQRLAVVEISLAARFAGPEPASADRAAWERALARFSSTSLIGNDDPQHVAHVRERAFGDACTLLSNPYFCELPVDRRAATILALRDTLLSVPSPDLIPVAELGLRQFHRMLDDLDLTAPQAMGVYDALHSLFFSGAADVRDLRRFDTVAPAFEAWLARRAPVQAHGKHTLTPATPLTIAYLLHTAHFDRGNAVSRLIVSLAQMHAASPERRVFLYLVQHIGPDFVSEISGTGFTVREFPQDGRYDRIDDIATALRNDRVDVVITEQNRAIAAALFIRRVAPVQIWADTGFPFWGLKSLDWTLSPAWGGPPNEQMRISTLSWRQMPETIKGDSNPAVVERVRAQFPQNAFILGVFVRLVKITSDFLVLLDRLLESNSTFHLQIAGTGDAAAIHSFISRSPHRTRIRFHHGNVDLNIYRHVVDVMCDTFPFIGGNACREVGAGGTAVVSMLGTPWDAFLHQDRSPDLLARTPDEYVGLIERLHRDNAFRAQQRATAIALLEQQTNPQKMIDDVEHGITAAIAIRG